jgi:hypothetical protein
MSDLDWVKSLAVAWGREVRRFNKRAQGVSGTMGRIYEEGPDGAAIRSYRPDDIQGMPKIDFPREINKFHRAWIDLDYELKSILVVDFVVPNRRGKKHKKWGALEVSKDAYYRRRNRALTKIAMDFHLYE